MNSQRQPPPSLTTGFTPRPETACEIPPPPGEITAALDNINNLQCELTARLEQLCIKLGPILREPYPQEKNCKEGIAALPQTKIGREIQEHCHRLELSIHIIKDITDRV